MSRSLPPRGPRLARLPCPSPSPKVCSTCVCRVDDGHPTISSCHPLLLYLQSFAAESFPVSQLFSSGGQTVRASASASVFPMNIKGSFPLGLTDLISCCPRDSEESSPTLQFFSSSPYLWSSSVHDSDCSHKIKTLAPWKKSYHQPRQCIKKQRHHFADKVYILKAMVFPVVMYGCESWTIREGCSSF